MPSDKLPAEQLPLPPAGEALDLLGGVRVLDLTNSIAGPYATLLLADLGASVVKVERPGTGDDARAWGPPFLGGQSLWFMSVNRNKHSLALDYARPAGLAALHALVASADVIVVNLVDRIQRKLGVDHATLSALNPRLIHVSITGFGLTGPNADLPCYDLIAEGYSGVMDLTGEPAQDAQKVGTPAADLLAGADAAMGTLAAIIARARTGRGRAIDVSMVESMTRFMTPRLISYLGSGELPRRSGGKDSVIAIYQTFETADEPMTLGLGNDAIFARFCEAIGRPEVARDPRYATNADRRAERPSLVAEIAAVLRREPRAHWLRVFGRARIPAGPINRLDEVVGDPTLAARGLFYAAKRGDTPIPQVGLGIHFDGSASTYREPPPLLGEHSRDVLRSWLGWSERQVDELEEAGVLAPAAREGAP